MCWLMQKEYIEQLLATEFGWFCLEPLYLKDLISVYCRRRRRTKKSAECFKVRRLKLKWRQDVTRRQNRVLEHMTRPSLSPTSLENTSHRRLSECSDEFPRNSNSSHGETRSIIVMARNVYSWLLLQNISNLMEVTLKFPSTHISIAGCFKSFKQLLFIPTKSDKLINRSIDYNYQYKNYETE